MILIYLFLGLPKKKHLLRPTWSSRRSQNSWGVTFFTSTCPNAVISDFRPTSESDDTCARTRPFADKDDKSRAIFIGGNKIKKVNSAKFLGVIIDEQLNWDQHVQHLTKKLRSITGALCRIRKFIPNSLYLKLYSALFESHLTFGISVWGVSLKDNSNDKLFVTQKQCIRVLFRQIPRQAVNMCSNSTIWCTKTRPDLLWERTYKANFQ